MKILINKDGQIIGPLSEEETIRRFDKGEFTETDLAMVEGATGWHELGSYIVEEPIPLSPAAIRERTPSRLVPQSSEVLSSDAPAASPAVEPPRKPMGWQPWTITAVATTLLFVTVIWLGRSHRMDNGRVSAQRSKEGSPVQTVDALRSEMPQPSEQATAESKMATEGGAPDGSPAGSDGPATNIAAGSDASGPVSSAAQQGTRVLLQRDTMLLFRNEPFRKATAGEEFEVLAHRADTGRVYVRETDATGNVIALSLPAELVVALAEFPSGNSAQAKQMAEPARAPRDQANNAGGPQEISKPSLSMDVKTITSGGKVRSRNGAVVNQGWDYANGRQLKSEQYWSTRDRESRVGLSIQVQNFGKSPQELHIESYFMGTPVTGPRTPFLVSKSVESHTVGAGDRLSVEAFSEVARSSTRRDFSTRTNPIPYGTSGRVWSAGETTTGTKVSGWIVRLVAAEKVVQVRASSPSLEQLAKNPAALDQLAGQMRPEAPQ